MLVICFFVASQPESNATNSMSMEEASGRYIGPPLKSGTRGACGLFATIDVPRVSRRSILYSCVTPACTAALYSRAAALLADAIGHRGPRPGQSRHRRKDAALRRSA